MLCYCAINDGSKEERLRNPMYNSNKRLVDERNISERTANEFSNQQLRNEKRENEIHVASRNLAFLP